MLHRKLPKPLAYLMIMAILMSLFTFAPSAFAGGTITALQVPTVADADGQRLGTVKIQIAAGSVRNGDSIIVKLPSGVEFGSTVPAQVYNTTQAHANYLYAPNQVAGDDNGLTAGAYTVTILDPADEIQITANANQSADYDAFLWLYLGDIDIDEGESGDVTVTFDGPSDTGFPQGTVVVGKIAGTGALTLSVSGTDESNDTFDFALRIKEDVLGSLPNGDEVLKLKLPSGFKWDESNATNVRLNAIWGQDIRVDINVDEDELTIDMTGVDLNDDGDFDDTVNGVAESEAETTVASCWEFADLDFSVDDETKAKIGDVEMKIYSDASVNISKAVVGTYGEFGATIKASAPDTVALAGKSEQAISKIVIKESLEDSLVDGRTILLTLPANARWAKVDDQDVPLAVDTVVAEDSGVRLLYKGLVGTNDRTLKLEVDANGSDAAELEIEDCAVNLEAGVTGDLKIQVGGSAGLSGEITVAKVIDPVTASASKADVKLGLSGQAAGDITITEAQAGAIGDEDVKDGDAYIVLDLPDGIKFTSVPKVEVTEGDLDIGTVTRDNSDNWLIIPVDKASNEASTIKISDIKYTVDRTVPEGDVKVAVKGDALVETGNDTNGYFNTTDTFENSNSAATVVNAVVVTPAPGETKVTAVLTAGSTTMKVNDKEVSMDVAPYIKNDRLYVSARYCANALGVADQNIMWNGATQTATIVAGAKVIQMKVGSKTMIINGASIPMDTAPEIVPPGRVMLPIGWLAWALGATPTWDQATQTATLEL